MMGSLVLLAWLLIASPPAARSQVAVQAPDQMPADEWLKLLMSHPDDVTLWSRELERLRAAASSLARRGNPDSDVVLAMAVAGNHQLRGVALRHLKRYPEALTALSDSAALLDRTWNKAGCVQPGPQSRCGDIDERRVLTATFVASVRLDQQDADGAERALNEAVVYARRTSQYHDSLISLVQQLFARQAFGPTADLFIAEMKDALDQRDSPRMKVAIQLADAAFGRMFMAISWDLRTGTMRVRDPQGFVDNTGIGIGRSLKYGMTDSGEDHATFVTAMILEELTIDQKARVELDTATHGGYASVAEYLTNIRLTDYVRSEMVAGNFEPAAKYVYHELVFGTLSASEGLVCRDAPVKIPFSEVNRRLRGAPAGTVPPITLEILRAYERVAQFVSGSCHPRKR